MIIVGVIVVVMVVLAMAVMVWRLPRDPVPDPGFTGLRFVDPETGDVIRADAPYHNPDEWGAFNQLVGLFHYAAHRSRTAAWAAMNARAYVQRTGYGRIEPGQKAVTGR